MIHGLMGLMDSPAGLTGPINLGNPHEISMVELANVVLELTGSPSQLAFQASPPDDPRQRRPDIAMARARLGWSPQVPLHAGLQRTIAFFRNQHGESFHFPASRSLAVRAAL
jgi:UDP-glucuronate decarboxylase